jgi:hypothetical protein
VSAVCGARISEVGPEGDGECRLEERIPSIGLDTRHEGGMSALAILSDMTVTHM